MGLQDDKGHEEMMVLTVTPEKLAPGALQVQEELLAPPAHLDQLVRVELLVNLVSMELMEMMVILAPQGVMEFQEAPDQV